MNLERAFLHAIAEDFEDDTVRLIYADWLEDNGHTARAVFIRRHCAEARAGKPAPPGDHLPRWVEDGEAAWMAELPALQENPWTFTRGIPAGVSYNRHPVAHFLDDSPHIFTVPSIQTIFLECGETKEYFRRGDNEPRGTITAEQFQQLAKLRGLKQVQALHLRRANLLPKGWSRLLNSPHLKRVSLLDLEGCEFTDQAARTLVDSPLASRLTDLRLGAQGFGYWNYDGWGLIEWGGIDPTVMATALAILAAAPSLAGLRALDLCKNDLNRSDAEALIQSPHLSSDLRLKIKQTGLDDDTIRTLRERFRVVES